MLRIAVTSDLHVDLAKPWTPEDVARSIAEYCASLEPDLFIVAGDISADTGAFRNALRIFSLEYGLRTAIVPGNHDLWAEPDVQAFRDSSFRHNELLRWICDEAKVHPLWLEPLFLDGVRFVGTYGHYDYSFCPEELADPRFFECKRIGQTVWNDLHYMWWGEFATKGQFRPTVLDDRALFQALLERFETQLTTPTPNNDPVRMTVAVIHTVPFAQCLKWTGDPGYDAWSAFLGGRALGETLQKHDVAVAIYGHTHHNNDLEIDGIRAINAAFGYCRSPEWNGARTPRERAEQAVRVLEI